MRQEHREKLLVELSSRVVQEILHQADNGPGQGLEELLGETLFLELRRLKTEPQGQRRDQDRAFWDKVRKRLPQASENELQDLLEQAVQNYAKEIAGRFDPRIYGFATGILPPALGVLLNAVSPRKLMRQLPKIPDLGQHLRLQGALEHVRSLDKRGTIIFTPTHLSNLDSIILGWSMFAAGLPPVVYGAGLNLFANPVLGFFMNNLGAYTVDRRKRNGLYKRVLKNYATLTLEFGYNNLFFPGGTRSRSGALEQHLKLGLLGTGLQAYINNLSNDVDKPDVFVVPCTLSYELVLEAETLIDDWLQEAGKSRYIISDDEFSKPRKVASFIHQLASLDSNIYVTFGHGYDVFGNPVDDQGQTLDPQGRVVDRARYVLNEQEEVATDAQRDAEYTRELGEQIGRAFYRDNVVYATHILARVMFSLLSEHNPEMPLFKLLRSGGRRRDVEMREVYARTAQVFARLKELEAAGEIRLDQGLMQVDAEDLVRNGLGHFAIYHSTAAVARRGDRLYSPDRNLMLYYANRLDGYGLDGLDATTTIKPQEA